MKKLSVILFLMLLCKPVEAQMTDMLGTLSLQGALTQGSMQGVGQMNNAMGNLGFQQDLTTLIMEVQSRFFGNYNGLNKDLLQFGGLKNYDWNVYAVSANQFAVEFKNLDGGACFICRGNGWNASSVDINGGGQCEAQNNHVILYF